MYAKLSVDVIKAWEQSQDHVGQVYSVLPRRHKAAATSGRGLSWASTSNLRQVWFGAVRANVQVKGVPIQETLITGGHYFCMWAKRRILNCLLCHP